MISDQKTVKQTASHSKNDVTEHFAGANEQVLYSLHELECQKKTALFKSLNECKDKEEYEKQHSARWIKENGLNYTLLTYPSELEKEQVYNENGVKVKPFRYEQLSEQINEQTAEGIFTQEEHARVGAYIRTTYKRVLQKGENPMSHIKLQEHINELQKNGFKVHLDAEFEGRGIGNLINKKGAVAIEPFKSKK